MVLEGADIIERLRLQVLSGTEAEKVLLETVVDTGTCNPVQQHAKL